MSSTLQQPTRAEVDAVEKVLADAHSQPCDGYWRPLAEASLEAAADIRLNTFVDLIDRDIEACEAAIASHRGQHGLGRLREAAPAALVIATVGDPVDLLETGLGR